jgi:hypothetical protein
VRLPPEWRDRVLVLDVYLILDKGDAHILYQHLKPHLEKKGR